MNNSDFESILTSAAKSTLEEIVKDYRDELLARAASNSAAFDPDIVEISVSDVVQAQSERQSLKGVRFSRFEQFLRIYALFGIMMALVGIGYYFYNNILVDLTTTDRFSLMVASTGAVLSLTSFFALQLLSNRRQIEFMQDLAGKDNFLIAGEFLKNWREIEANLQKAALVHFGESSITPSFSKTLSSFENKILTRYEVEILREAYSSRNRLVHSSSELNESEVSEMRQKIIEARKISERLIRKVA